VLEPGGVRDSSVVRGVWLDDVEFGTTTITVTGRVSVDGPGAVDPAADLLELRVNTSDDEIGTEDPDLREEIGSDVQEDGTWTHVITTTADVVTAARADSETVLEWSDASSTEMTIGEFGVPEPIEGCPPRGSEPTAPLLLASQDSGKAGDHRTNQATGLTFSGLAGTGLGAESGADQTVRLQVDGADFGEVTADSDGVYQFTGVDLAARATPHTVRVISPEGDASRTVRVDTTAPGVRVRSFGPSPLHLTGADQLRAVYRVSESATLRARIDHIHPTRLVRAFAKRTVSRDGLAEFTWNGTNVTERNVRPGRYQVVVEVTDKVGNVTVQRNLLRVVR
jgi:hypothetical protein